jgi:hypothetical protein
MSKPFCFLALEIIAMVTYTARILKFGTKGEKTGWTYVEIPPDVASKLKPGHKKSFHVKGKLDAHPIKRVAILPMGEGGFIMPLNMRMRKALGKKEGAILKLQLEEDKARFIMDRNLMTCLKDESEAFNFFKTLSGSHQRYFSKWVAEAKTEATKAKRIANIITAMLHKQGYGEMLRSLSGKNKSSY